MIGSRQTQWVPPDSVGPARLSHYFKMSKPKGWQFVHCKFNEQPFVFEVNMKDKVCKVGALFTKFFGKHFTESFFATFPEEYMIVRTKVSKLDDFISALNETPPIQPKMKKFKVERLRQLKAVLFKFRQEYEDSQELKETPHESKTTIHQESPSTFLQPMPKEDISTSLQSMPIENLPTALQSIGTQPQTSLISEHNFEDLMHHVPPGHAFNENTLQAIWIECKGSIKEFVRFMRLIQEDKTQSEKQMSLLEHQSNKKIALFEQESEQKRLHSEEEHKQRCELMRQESTIRSNIASEVAMTSSYTEKPTKRRKTNTGGVKFSGPLDWDRM